MTKSSEQLVKKKERKKLLSISFLLCKSANSVKMLSFDSAFILRPQHNKMSRPPAQSLG